MNKKARSADLHAAISELAALYEYGELRASTDPAGLLREVAAEVRRLRHRTALQERALKAAVEVRRSYVSAGDDWGANCYSDALRCLHAAVDALLAAEPAWGEGE